MEVRPRTGRLLGALGSGEFEPWTRPFDEFLLSRSTGSGPVALLPTASAPDGDDVFTAWAQKGLEHYRALGTDAQVCDVRAREDAFKEDPAAQVRDATLIFFSGGKPSYLASVLGDTPLWTAIREAADRGAALAGCSAGACIFGELAPDSVTEHADRTTWVPGLSLLEDVLVVPHWDALDDHEPGQRSRILNGHAQGRWVFSIDENTAAACAGDTWTVFGSGVARVTRGEHSRAFRAGEQFDLLHARP